jgi:S1-C subfamily serine protease
MTYYKHHGQEMCCPGNVEQVGNTFGCTTSKDDKGRMACTITEEIEKKHCKTIIHCDDVPIIPDVTQGPQGPPGPQGPQGPQGPPGTTTIQTLTENISANIYEQVKYASVSLHMRTANAEFTGSGFIIKHKNKNYIVSVAHNVMIGNRNNLVSDIHASILLPNGTPMLVPCKAIGVAGRADVTVLEILNNNLGELKHVEWSLSEVKTGDTSFVVGDPLGLDAISISQGTVRDSAYIIGNIIESISTTAAIYPGNSGSPIFNIMGEVIGIVSYSHGNSENFGWGCSYKIMKTLVETIIDGYINTGSNTNFIGGTLGQNMTAVDSQYLLAMGKTNSALKGYYFNTYNDGWNPYYIVEEIDDEIIGVYDTQKTPCNIYTEYNKNFKLKLGFITAPSFSQIIYRKPRQLTISEDVPLGGSNNTDFKLVEPVKKRNLLSAKKVNHRSFKAMLL